MADDDATPDDRPANAAVTGRADRAGHRVATIRIALAIAFGANLVACQSALSTQTPGGSGAPQVSSVPHSGGPQGSGAKPDSPATPDGPAVEAARAAIDANNLADPATLEPLMVIRFTDEGAAAAAQAIQSGATGDALWAATWIYEASGTEPDVLMPLLSNPDVSVQAMAAVTLLAWGKREAAPVLVQLLSASGFIRGSEPPTSVSGFAAGALDRFVKGPEIAATATPEELAAAWSSWFGANQAAMQYDPDTARWHSP
jgi:hypothetical protein